MSTGNIGKPSSYEPTFEFPIKKEPVLNAEQSAKRREKAQRILEISEPTERDLQIAHLIRTQISSDYVPTRMRDLRGIPDHVLKAAEAIPQAPVLSPTDEVCETHSVFHEGQGIEDINCAFCRESIRDRIRREIEESRPRINSPTFSGEEPFFEKNRPVVFRTQGRTISGGSYSCFDFYWARWFGYELTKGCENHIPKPSRVPVNREAVENKVREFLKKAGGL
jgi:hypothetical protein